MSCKKANASGICRVELPRPEEVWIVRVPADVLAAFRAAGRKGGEK